MRPAWDEDADKRDSEAGSRRVLTSLVTERPLSPELQPSDYGRSYCSADYHEHL